MMDDWGSGHGRRRDFFSLRHCAYTGCNREGEVFPEGRVGRGVKLNTHLHLESRLRIRGIITPLIHMIA
jgi:hypothetical protein